MDVPVRTLVISDGGVGALVACMAARESLYASVSAAAAREGGDARPGEPGTTPEVLRERRPLVFLGDLPPSSGAARLRAVERQCAALDLELVEPSPADSVPTGAPRGERATRMLLGAGFAAAQRGAGRVIWPVHCFDGTDIDLDQIADAFDRSTLVTRLLGLDAQPGVRVEVPYADFTDLQMAELAVDLDAPLRLCWWWHAQLAGPSGGDGAAGEDFRAEHRRWSGLLRDAGWVQEAEMA